MSCNVPSEKELAEQEELTRMLTHIQGDRPLDGSVGFEPKEMVNHPVHYSQFSYEPIDVIEDWKLGFNLGNALKYISRCDSKGNPIQDLQKSIWYIQREIALRQK